MGQSSFRVAMISEVFAGPGGAAALHAGLAEACSQGADLVVLPELPCNGWAPASRGACAEDAEPPGGPRYDMLSSAAREQGVALLGGAIVVDPVTQVRHNTALLFGADGVLVHSYRKVHIPQEEGFYEQDHYEPGAEPPQRIDAFSMPLGIQICSDINRPEGCHVLGALGVELVLVPRATEWATFARWELMFRANALTSCCYIVSVNRPAPEQGVLLGGPSIAVAPDGEVLSCSEDRLILVELARDRVAQCRQDYPGYLTEAADVYAEGWRSVGER